MHKKNRGIIYGTVIFTAAVLSTKVSAQELLQAEKRISESIDLGEWSMDSQALDGIRAREGTSTFEQMNESDQRAWLEQNRLQSHMTGNNIMHESAMRIEGIGSVIQNSGNQVIIQDTTQINLSISP